MWEWSPLGGGKARQIYSRSVVIQSSVTRAGGGAWSTASLYHPCLLLQASWGRGGSPFSRRYTSSPAVVTRLQLSSLGEALIAQTNCLSRL